MSPQYVVALGKETIIMVLMVASPMLAFGLIVGLSISIFQAVTQIHEMTLTFIPKIIAVGVGLLIFLPWMIKLLVEFTTRILTSIPGLVA